MRKTVGYTGIDLSYSKTLVIANIYSQDGKNWSPTICEIPKLKIKELPLLAYPSVHDT